MYLYSVHVGLCPSPNVTIPTPASIEVIEHYKAMCQALFKTLALGEAFAALHIFSAYMYTVFSPGFILSVSEISKFGITQIYPCRTMANAICISIYRLTCYRYFVHVLSAHAFRNLRYFIQPIATDHAILWSFPVLRFTR